MRLNNNTVFILYCPTRFPLELSPADGKLGLEMLHIIRDLGIGLEFRFPLLDLFHHTCRDIAIICPTFGLRVKECS